MSIPKFKKPDWFDINKYENARNLNPLKWATELHVRHYLLRNDISSLNDKKQFLSWFDIIKSNGVLNLDDTGNALSKANEGIIYHRDSIENRGSHIKYAESIRQKHAKLNLFTESVEVLTVSDLNQFNEGLSGNLKASCNSMWRLFHESVDQPISESNKELIDNACQLYGIESNNNELALLQIDLSAPNKMILSEFKKVLLALRKIKPLSTNAKALQANDWRQRANRLTDDLVLPYLDLLIHSRLINHRLEDDTAQDIICGNNADGKITQKVQRTIKHNAMKMIQLEQIEALRMLYFSEPKTYWDNS